MIDLESVTLGAAMIHNIPRAGSDEEPVLTDAAVDLDRGLRSYFRDKLVASLSTRGVDAVADQVNGDPTVREAVAESMASSDRLVAASKRMALRLAAIQNAHNPPGLFTVFQATAGGLPTVALMKLERESGIRFEIRDEDGRAIVDLELLRKLTLTNKTKVFKTALFYLEEPGDPASLVGRVSDNQRGIADGRGVADFFLRTFLGCDLALNPARSTSEFATAVSTFINSDEVAPNAKGRYQVALLAELQNNKIDLVPQEFARAHVAAEHRAQFVETLRDAGVEPQVGFEKDTSLVRMESFRMTFESGMTLLGRGDDLEQRVRMRDQDEPPGVDINDPVKTLQGR